MRPSILALVLALSSPLALGQIHSREKLKVIESREIFHCETTDLVDVIVSAGKVLTKVNLPDGKSSEVVEDFYAVRAQGREVDLLHRLKVKATNKELRVRSDQDERFSILESLVILQAGGGLLTKDGERNTLKINLRQQTGSLEHLKHQHPKFELKFRNCVDLRS